MVADKGKGSDAVHVEKREPLVEALMALDEKHYSTFESKVQEAIDSETDEDRRLALKAWRLGELCRGGQTNRMEELQALRQDYPQSPHPIIQLGICYDFPGGHQKAAELYREGFQLPKLTALQRLTLLRLRARALRKTKLFDDAEQCLIGGLQKAETDGEKADVEKALAELYEDWGKKDEMLMHLEEAVDLNPGDLDARFELGYAYSQEGYKLLAFHHYDILRTRRNGSAELNNLAVILQGLEAPITAAKFYRSAANQRNGLAAANLARMMAQGGLAAEARDVLDEAREEEQADQAVDTASAAITRWEKHEQERLDKIRDAAAIEHELALRRFELQRENLSPLRAEDIEGTWKTNVGDMTFQRRENKVVARFKPRYWEWELTGEVSGRTYSFTWKCDEPGGNKQGDGFFILRTDSEFEGIIRHTPEKGEVREVTGGERKAHGPPEQQGQAESLYKAWLRRTPRS